MRYARRMMTATADHPSAPDAPLRLGLEDEGATEAFGRTLAAALGPGDTVLLSGPLGAGKSALARAVIRARLADPDREVPSPSYTLVNIHESGAEEIWHADLYRLSGPEETAELGLAEAFESALVLVEWPDRLGQDIPARRLEVALSVVSDTGREAVVRPVGRGWDRLRKILSAWR